MSSQCPLPPVIKPPPAPGLGRTSLSWNALPLYSTPLLTPGLSSWPAWATCLNFFRTCVVSGELDLSPPAPATLPGHQGQQLSSPSGSPQSGACGSQGTIHRDSWNNTQSGQSKWKRTPGQVPGLGSSLGKSETWAVLLAPSTLFLEASHQNQNWAEA